MAGKKGAIRKPAANAYSEEEVQFIKDNIGESGGDLAALMSEKFNRYFSRNAIIGKVHRLGFVVGDGLKSKPRTHKRRSQRQKNRFSQKTEEEIREAKINGGKNSVILARMNREPASLPKDSIPSLEKVDAPPPMLLTLVEIGERQCKWPFGDRDVKYCGHPIEGRSSYCAAHNAGKRRTDWVVGKRTRSTIPY